MAFPKHLLLSFGGSMGNDEIWSNNVRLTSTNDLSYEDFYAAALDQIDEIATEVKTYVSNPWSHYSSSCKLLFVKLNPIAADGRYWNTGATNAIYYTPAAPGAVGQAAPGPFQVALAVTLRTFQERGPAHSGRWYVPAGELDVDTATGAVSSGTAEQLRDSTAILLNAINDNPGIDQKGIIAAVVSGTHGVWNAVTAVQVGRVPDTQRRRRNALSENYTAPAAVTGQ